MNRRLVLASAFWVLLLAAVVGAVAAFVWNRHRAVQEQLSAIEPRYARMLGLGADRARMEGLARQSREALSRHVYPATGDVAQAGNLAQERARTLFAQSGLEVQSIQVLPARTAGRFDRIPIAVRLGGELLALQAALAAMPNLAPTLFVEGFTILTQEIKPDAEPKLAVQFELFVLRARE